MFAADMIEFIGTPEFYLFQVCGDIWHTFPSMTMIYILILKTDIILTQWVLLLKKYVRFRKLQIVIR